MTVTLDEKLAPQETTPGTKARAKLSHLRVRWGVESELDPANPPDLVFITFDTRREVWARRGRPDKADTLYEMIEVRDAVRREEGP